MQKQEFEQLIQTAISDEEYRIIDKVYTWHPAISETAGKSQIADLYRSGGMTVIKNMEETADVLIELDRQEREYLKRIEEIRQRKDKVKAGNLEYERARIAVEKAFSTTDTATEFARAMEILRSVFGEVAMKVAEDLYYI